MGVKVNWDDQFRPSSTGVIHITYSDPWTWNDFYDAMNQVETMTMGNSGPINFINDFSHSSSLPHSNLNHLAEFIRTLDEVGGTHVIVQFGTLWNSLQSVISSRYPQMGPRIYGSSSVEDAQHLLLTKQ